MYIYLYNKYINTLYLQSIKENIFIKIKIKLLYLNLKKNTELCKIKNIS